MDPQTALTKLRAAGFQEGEEYRDIRAGRIKLVTLTADTVMFVSSEGTPLEMGNATNLWESYQNESIQLDEGES